MISAPRVSLSAALVLVLASATTFGQSPSSGSAALAGSTAIAGSAAIAAPAMSPVAVPTIAASPKLAAVAASPDNALASTLVGPSGQVYVADAHGAWIRRTEGGIAATVTTATVIAATRDGSPRSFIAGGAGSPPYRYADGAWTALHLGRGAIVVGRGTRAVVAVGRGLFAIGGEREPNHLADAPAAIVALAAGTSVVVATAQDVYRLDGTTFRRLDSVPHDATLISDRWATTDRAAISISATGATATAIPWPAGLAITATAPIADGSLAAAGTTPAGLELVVVRGGSAAAPPSAHAGAAAITRSPIPLADPARAVGIAVDRAGRVVVATADGRVAVRDHGQWTIATVRDELPAPRPGAPPATSP